MTKIYRYIDDPPSLLLWEIDEIVVLSLLMIIGLVTDTLTILILLGFVVNFFIGKLKEQKSEGFMLHYIYWVGLFKIKKALPSPGIVNKYIE